MIGEVIRSEQLAYLYSYSFTQPIRTSDPSNGLLTSRVHTVRYH